MIRSFRMRPATPPPPSFDLSLEMTEPGATVADCACADLSIAWFNGTAFAVALETDDVYPSFAIGGFICPDATYEVTQIWEPDAAGAEPVGTKFGASAWSEQPFAPGILTVNVTANCGGEAITLGPIFLTIVAATYYVAPCVAPAAYTSINLLIDAGCVQAVLHGITSDIVFTAFDSILVNDGPFYQGPAGTPTSQTCISFVGLDTLFGSSDMDVRVSIFSCDLVDGGPLGFYVDNKSSLVDGDPLPGNWEYTVANADIHDWFTGAGVGTGSGGTGSCEFMIELRVHV